MLDFYEIYRNSPYLYTKPFQNFNLLYMRFTVAQRYPARGCK